MGDVVSNRPRVEITGGVQAAIDVKPDGVVLSSNGQSAQELSYILRTGTPSTDTLRLIAGAKKLRLSINSGTIDPTSPGTGETIIFEYDVSTNMLTMTPTLVTPNNASPILSSVITFTESAGAGVYTGTVVVPAGALITSIVARSLTLWTAPALLDVGDGLLSDGWYANVNLTATTGQRAVDLPVGNELNFGGVAALNRGVWISSASVRTRVFSTATRNVVARIQTTGAVGATGVTRVAVHYVIDNPIAATKTTA